MTSSHGGDSVAGVNNSDGAPTPELSAEPLDQSQSEQPALDTFEANQLGEAAPDEAEQSELDLGVISTGTPVVDQALAPLEGLTDLPVADHPEIFDRVLSDLSATMAEGVADESSPRDA